MDQDDRIAAALQWMSVHGVELLIACSSGLHMPDRPDPVAHVSGYRSLGESFFLLHGDGTSKLIVSPATDKERLACHSGRQACIARDNLEETLTQELGDCGLTGAQISIVGIDAMPHLFAEQLHAQHKGAAITLDDSFYRASGRKTAVEIARARRAAAIAQKGLERLLQLACPGMRECDLAVELKLYMESLGADDNFLMLCASPHNPAVMPRILPGLSMPRISPRS